MTTTYTPPRLHPYIVQDLHDGVEYPVLADCEHCAVDIICGHLNTDADDSLIVLNTNRRVVMGA